MKVWLNLPEFWGWEFHGAVFVARSFQSGLLDVQKVGERMAVAHIAGMIADVFCSELEGY